MYEAKPFIARDNLLRINIIKIKYIMCKLYSRDWGCCWWWWWWWWCWWLWTRSLSAAGSVWLGCGWWCGGSVGERGRRNNVSVAAVVVVALSAVAITTVAAVAAAVAAAASTTWPRTTTTSRPAATAVCWTRSAVAFTSVYAAALERMSDSDVITAARQQIAGR